MITFLLCGGSKTVRNKFKTTGVYFSFFLDSSSQTSEYLKKEVKLLITKYIPAAEIPQGFFLTCQSSEIQILFFVFFENNKLSLFK